MPVRESTSEEVWCELVLDTTLQLKEHVYTGRLL